MLNHLLISFLVGLAGVAPAANESNHLRHLTGLTHRLLFIVSQ